MGKKILIASDSTTDLGADLIARYGVRIVPLGVNLGGKHYTDGVDIGPEKIYAHYEQTGELPKTAAVNIAEYADFFERCTKEGYAVVLFSISAEMSSSYQNACLASADFEDVYVVDTRNLSTGGGLLVVSAGEMVKAGKSAAEIAQSCRTLASRVDASFVIDDLEFLHKGGRCSSLAALGANLLHLKPCIEVRDGKMTVGKKYRGKFSAVLKQYIADRIGDASGIDLDRVFITHAGCDEETVQMCAELVRQLAPFREVFITRAGCTISAHCGRNTLGVLFLRKDG